MSFLSVRVRNRRSGCPASLAPGFFALAGALLAGLAPRLEAVPQPSVLFGDNAVLQRDAAAPVWGRAEPHEEITVRLGPVTARAVAAADGRWQAVLRTPASQEPGELVFESAQGRVVSRNVVVGDVWLCSGQSNMEWSLRKTAGADREIAAATYPALRQFKVKSRSSETPLAELEGAWVVCSPETAGQFTAVGYFFARDLHRHSGLPQGLINSSWGATIIEAWSSAESLRARPDLTPVLERWARTTAAFPAKQKAQQAEMALWQQEKRAADAAGAPFAKKKPAVPPGGPADRNRPSGTFNAMIQPVIPSALRGVLWYQGEHNAARAEEYRILLQNLIADWRQRWQRPDLPFLIVQLPNISSPTSRTWTGLREAQAAAQALPATALAVTADLGDSATIHPLDKRGVGARLALLARELIDGEKLGAAGPRFVKATRQGDGLRLEFDRDTSGLTLREKPFDGTAFELAGADRIFHPAVASLRAGEVTVASPEVAAPVAVRYAWRATPAVVLFNRAGLPVAPFRSDDWLEGPAAEPLP